MTITRHVAVTGGGGFIGSHLCRALLDRGDRVTAIDNFCTGHEANIDPILDESQFRLQLGDICDPDTFAGITDITDIVHLACPASPKANAAMPIDTIRAATVGTLNVLELAHHVGARCVVASSSEVYGDPLVHPQAEDYRGNCDPVGAHSAYTEGKRVAEAAAAAYQRIGANVGIVRPFNVYGPNMWPDDGRVIAAFCSAALRGETLRLEGGGTQTRSLVWVGDFIAGLIAMLDSEEAGPINLGSTDEITIADLAQLVIDRAGSGSVQIAPGRDEVVAVRRPDITRAHTLLGWQPHTCLADGLTITVQWMRAVLQP
ncbi:NAD-dependent epimerase/dehydratase family protein [Nocardia sp. NBC_00508]|uniref:NAD-dependent epimerase/dehydratase family protein n=1 Tax=Nocardia sp. NBC_00508 TaxID=2975992 RepID=UPI002E80C4B3|nr:NAD-dependent epimerase/dehydratase family protein [Nocardia sp. NBC_00508]WUD68679.1 NAD-dependent epimerase/dehydratase family protein [Nocardia sp. NBC_00508]